MNSETGEMFPLTPAVAQQLAAMGLPTEERDGHRIVQLTPELYREAQARVQAEADQDRRRAALRAKRKARQAGRAQQDQAPRRRRARTHSN